jgi:hypothetical protein
MGDLHGFHRDFASVYEFDGKIENNFEGKPAAVFSQRGGGDFNDRMLLTLDELNKRVNPATWEKNISPEFKDESIRQFQDGRAALIAAGVKPTIPAKGPKLGNPH